MTFDDIMEQALDMLRHRGRVSYRSLKRQCTLDDDDLADLKAEMLDTPGCRTVNVGEGRSRSAQEL